MDVPSDLADLGPARGAIVDQVTSWGAPVDPAVLALLVSEVVANAVEHGSPPIVATVDWDGARIRVEVRDAAPAMPVRRQPDHDDDGGRGIWLVDRNASAWGVEQADGGKSVWFELRCSGAHPQEGAQAQEVVGGRADRRST